MSLIRKIVFDNIIFNLQKFGGVSNYWHQLYIRLVNDPDFDSFFIEYKNQNIFATNQNIPQKKIVPVCSKLPIYISRFINPKINTFNSSFIFHSSYNRYSTNKFALNITTIHDLIHFKYYNGFRKLIHNTQKKYALLNSAAIITISENTKTDLLNFFPQISPNNIHVVYNGVSDEFYKIHQKQYKYELDEEVINQNYILWVSSREMYKNFSFAVELLNKLPDFKFYIVGSKLSNQEIFKLNTLIPRRWKLFTGISTSTLNELYNHAHLLLYPSSYEGFGIPILEAMKSGCPFIASNNSSIPEVAGKAGILIDELNIEDYLSSIINIKEKRESLILSGFDQSKKFSWDRCYMETKNIYNQLLSK